MGTATRASGKASPSGRERIGLIGGQWSLKSMPGSGTTIFVNWHMEGQKQ